MAETIIGIITGVMAVITYVYVSFTMRNREPILTNEYLFASKEEQKKLTEKSHLEVERDYHVVSVIFGTIGTIFAFITIYIFTNWRGCFYILFILIVFVLCYAIKESVKGQRRR